MAELRAALEGRAQQSRLSRVTRRQGRKAAKGVNRARRTVQRAHTALHKARSVHRAAKDEMTALRAAHNLQSAALASGDSGSQKPLSLRASKSGAERRQRASSPAGSGKQFDLF